MIQWGGEGAKEQRFINLNDVIDIAQGCRTTEVMRRNNIPQEFDQFCFSIITKYRTLDLKSGDTKIKKSWINHLYKVLIQRRQEISLKFSNKRKLRDNYERIDEIWRVDIFPNWEKHWDYTKHQPKHLNRYDASKQSRVDSILKYVCSCFSKSKSNDYTRNKTLMIRAQKNSDLQRFDEDELQLPNTKKSLLLITLWKIGIPKWVRKTLWPLAIGNRLEITEDLYNILLQQINYYQDNPNGQQNDNSIAHSLSRLEKDPAIKQLTYIENPTSLLNVLKAFIIYRPDIGYVQKVMPALVQALLQYLDEYTTFQCFINLLHSNHFLPFFRGELREIQWRIRFFDDHLLKRIPLVYHHFKALDLTSDLFLIDWFLTLFSNMIENQECLARIWDNFFLEGEIFAYKCSLAIIDFFQLELKMSTFDDAIKLLKSAPHLLVEEHLFEIIEDIKIKYSDF